MALLELEVPPEIDNPASPNQTSLASTTMTTYMGPCILPLEQYPQQTTPAAISHPLPPPSSVHPQISPIWRNNTFKTE
eukprot:456214-Pelagomonas_calceolata.AAC.10